MFLYTHTVMAGLFICILLSTVASQSEEDDLSSEEEVEVRKGRMKANKSVKPDPHSRNIMVNDKQFTVYFTEKNWWSALEHCARYNQILAKIKSEEEGLQLRNALLEYGVKDNENFWLGGNDLGHSDQWVWVSNGKYIGFYTNWAPNQPSAEHCIELLDNDQWQATNCDQKRKFLCERRVRKHG